MNGWSEAPNPILVSQLRGMALEVQHRATFAVAREGRIVRRAGASSEPVCVRSGAKFFQALTPIRRGVVERFGLGARHVALMGASHNGEGEHVIVAREMLDAGELSVGDLGCGTHPPMAAAARRALQAIGSAPSPLHNNCSGKHAGMLLAARIAGEPIASVLDPDHPLQVANRACLALHAGVSAEEVIVGIDGCSAPTFTLSPEAVAVAFSQLGRTGDTEMDGAATEVIAALRAEPFMLGGSKRFDTMLVRATGGRWLSKVGAEGFHGATCPDEGIGVALHVDDGSRIAAERLLLALIHQLDPLSPAAWRGLRPAWDPLRRNHAGRIAGHVVCHLATP